MSQTQTTAAQWRKAVTREARAAPEFAAFLTVAGPMTLAAPRGDGHAVIVLPGLGAGDLSTRPLRWFLDRLGYRTYGWGLGTNRGVSRAVASGLDELLRRVRADSGRRVSLVGWSLGGVHAAHLAHRHPGDVRYLVTLGSPLGDWAQPPATVPSTSVYSRTDSIVPWRIAQLPSRGHHESVEVRGSHLGLGHNPAVLVVVADRLAQPAGTWRPFTPPRWARRWIPQPTRA